MMFCSYDYIKPLVAWSLSQLILEVEGTPWTSCWFITGLT